MKAKSLHINVSNPIASRVAVILAIATATLTLARALALYLAFDPALGYFTSPLISSLLYILTAAICIAGCTLAFWRSPYLRRKKKEKKTSEQKQAEKKRAKQEKAHLKALKRAGVKLPLNPLPTLVPPLRRERTPLTRATDWTCAAAFLVAAAIDASLLPLPRLRVLLALISALAFFLPLSGHPLSPLARLAHLAPCAYCIVCIAADYFDWNAPMNGPAKVGTQLTLCAMLLYLNSNARLAIVDHILRCRNICAVLASVFGISFGVASLLAIPTGAVLSIAISPMLISAAVGIHAALSLISTFRDDVPTLVAPPKPTPPPLPKSKDEVSTDKERQEHA